MAQVSPSRPRRATQRQRIVDSDDESDVALKNEPASDEDTFVPPSPTKTPQRASRRKTQAVLETSAENEAGDAATALKKFSKPRRNVRASRRSQASITIAADERASLPAPSSSTSPQSLTPAEEVPIAGISADVAQAKTPLSDITQAAINELPLQVAPEKPLANPPIPPAEGRPTFEKPMDIVIRTRAKASPVSQEPAQPKPRMVITYLILTNFKSYAGRQEVGPFHASFSSVVGPNGSGKSNVIDSLLFVFGFRASKMRQGKISALIHNSAAFPDLPYCEVEVRFQEVLDQAGGKCDVMPDSQIIISRKAFKNNSSKYYINGSESNFTTVTTLLRERGVDLDHKRFLILQGEVESIAQMKPKAASEHDDGLLEYLEDIIGTSKYKTPIEESAAETETLNEVCVEKNNRVAHVEKEKKSLEAKKDAALAYIRDENALVAKQSALYQVYVAECEDNIHVTAEAVEQIQGELNKEAEKHNSSEQEIKILQKEYNSELKQFERLEQSTQATLKQLAKADKEAVKFEERRKHLNTKIKKLEKSMTTSQAGVSEASSYLEHLADDLTRNSKEINVLESRLKNEEVELASIRDSLKGKTQGISDQIGEKQKLLEPWTKQISQQQSAIAVAQSELAILQERDSATAKALEEATARLARHRGDRETKATELRDYQKEKKVLEKRMKEIQASLHKLGKLEPDKRSKLSTARQNADEARASLSKTQTQGNVLNGLLRLRDSGRITGFHGRLGDLGVIDAKYDIAISTACPSLDNLVVDSVEVGQQCIEHLRKNNLGRANFILLDRLSRRDLSAIETPEGVPRLFDLVRAKHDKFAPAFYNVLQNTLVASDLQQANQIAYGAKRWRVVTLDGQLIDKSGTMSGGGTRVAKGAMSSKLVAEVSKEQVADLESKREELERQFENFQQERQDAESALRQLSEDIPSLDTKLQRCTLELESLDRTVEDTEKRCSELSSTEKTGSTDAVRINALETTIAEVEQEIESLSGNASGIQSEIQALQDKIMEVGGVKLRGQKAKVDGLKDQINTLAEEMSNAEVSKAKTQKLKTKHEKTLKEASTDLESLAKDTKKLDEELQQHNNDTSGSKRESEEAQEVR